MITVDMIHKTLLRYTVPPTIMGMAINNQHLITTEYFNYRSGD
jgi:hypothetical protein